MRYPEDVRKDGERSPKMKAIKSLLVAAFAAAGLAATADAQADRGAGHIGGGSGHWSGGGGHWSGGGGHWSGGGHWGGRSWGGRWYGPRVGLYLGAPLLWSPWYWGYPYDYYYPRTVIYPEIERYPATYPDYPEGYMEPAPTTEIAPPRGAAPAQAPTYMNYCESAKAYFPKVTTCPEGWKFLPSR
jgi:hypothetical protein